VNAVPLFTRHDDGTITVDGYTDPVYIAPELLFAPCWLDTVERVGEWTFVLRAANGSATYRVVDFSDHALRAELVSTDGPRKDAT
jgi:hypothetical protein